MKCVVCHSENITNNEVMEELHVGNDVIRVPITVPVCGSCGERYYDRKTMKQLELIRSKVSDHSAELAEIGRVMVYKS